ncbi:receptor-like protein EIX1 [Ziziphus jujuba]|uniref:Receptor-like protein EIX1 n=2 Tax=Ziziphus jujuba TaxID=326968 RepID=A0ABM4ADT5_ZIZJJ|nr:receptor-like protein EIX1 [Ziziphus jujuba]KAH7520924.1 hypothetical protein FEM48_Zijuj08G0197300 [Ziziphus jujuba var. spinosa]
MAKRFSCVILLLLAFLHETPCLCDFTAINLGCNEEERSSLLEFKHSLSFTSLNRLTSWTGKDCCKWEGVNCSTIKNSVHVTKLDLRNHVKPDSSGFITQVPNWIKANFVSSALMGLNHLVHVDMNWNDFSGSRILAFLGFMQSLRYLNLSKACFDGLVPDQLRDLSNLHSLDLSSGPDEFVFRLFVENLEWLPGSAPCATLI